MRRSSPGPMPRIHTPRAFECGLGYVRIQLSRLHEDATTGAASARRIRQALAALDPDAEALFVAGKVEMSLPETQAMITSLLNSGVISAAEAEALADLGRTSSVRCQAWGFTEVTALDLTKAANYSGYTAAQWRIRDKADSDLAAIRATWEAGNVVE